MDLKGRRGMNTSDLVRLYGAALQQQVLNRGSVLACRDEALRMKAERLLADSNARETHRLGVEPLAVMEEALEAPGPRGPRRRAGLAALERAFEVLEQAALNLYLGPWREEYKVIKMYSGTFTHDIAPVLSAPLSQQLFGLLGYRPGPARPGLFRPQQLRLQPAAPSLEELLRLSCAFFLARCECRLLLAALGRRGGDERWELAVVRERRRGHALQASLENAEKWLAALPQAPTEPLEVEVDLYGEEPSSATSASDQEDPPPSIRTRRNGPDSGEALDASCRCLRLPAPGCQRRCDCGGAHDVACAHLADRGGPETARTASEEPRIQEPIGYHCPAAKAEPQLLCRTCRCFHGGACVEGRLCRQTHDTTALGTCSCGKRCSRKPLVLCHHCGLEFCTECWYKHPLACVCGVTFDPSTSV